MLPVLIIKNNIMKRGTIIKMLYAAIAFVLNNQNAQATKPPEFLSESPI